jgi:hypothetical protein
MLRTATIKRKDVEALAVGNREPTPSNWNLRLFIPWTTSQGLVRRILSRTETKAFRRAQLLLTTLQHSGNQFYVLQAAVGQHDHGLDEKNII